MTLQTPEGEEIDKVSIWSDFPDFGTYIVDGTIEGDMVAKGDFKNLYPIKKAAGGGMGKNMDRIVEKKAGLIAEAQEKKNQNIVAAQDRSAWMWAKTNAATLLAQSAFINSWTQDEMATEVIALATKIYNGEPSAPFN